MLLTLIDQAEAIVKNSAHSVECREEAASIEDLWEVSTGVGLAIDLYDHTVRSIVAHVYLVIWQGFDRSRKPTFLAETQPYDLTDQQTICPN